MLQNQSNHSEPKSKRNLDITQEPNGFRVPLRLAAPSLNLYIPKKVISHRVIRLLPDMKTGPKIGSECKEK